MRTFYLIGIFALSLLFAAYSGLSATYYVNDASTNNDVYCSAPGSDTNDGLTVVTPLASMTNLMALIDLEPNDVVYIDTGLYTNYQWTVNSNDRGSTAGYVNFIGSTNEYGSVFDRSDISGYLLYLTDADYTRFCYLTLRGARYGTFADNSDYLVFENMRFENNDRVGCFAQRSDHGFILRSVFENNDIAVDLHQWNSVNGWVFQNSVAYSNSIVFYGGAVDSVVVSNSVLVGGYLFDARGTVSSGDYNILWDTIPRAGSYERLLDLQAVADDWWHSTVIDPDFADSANGDYHPRSEQGRYDPVLTNWVYTDTNTSWVIDFGGPSGTFGNEPMPNGSNRNAGVFGDTSEASLSITNPWLRILSLNDGGSLSTTVRLVWCSENYTNGSKATLGYSVDAGNTWSNIASDLPVTNHQYIWVATNANPGLRCYWRISCNGDIATNRDFFALRGAGAKFSLYVNDDTTNNDIYCMAIGSETNTGLTPLSPRSDLESLIEDYSLGAGDKIYVDAGYYAISNSVDFTWRDQGSASEALTVQGCTNAGRPLTILRQVSGGHIFRLADASYCAFRNMELRNASRAFSFETSLGNSLYGLYLCSNSIAFYGQNAERITVSHSMAAGNACMFDLHQWGSCNDWIADHVVSVNNDEACYLGSVGDSIYISNSVFVGGNIFQSGSPVAYGDYNVLWNCSIQESGYADLSSFQKNLDSWWHSIVADPQFADINNLDFHPLSKQGRYDPNLTNWVYADTNYSLLLDFGDPEASYTNEPVPNGSNVNAGMFGNTWEASLSRTGAWLQAVSYNDGGLLNAGVDTIYWTGGNIESNGTVMIQLSRDSGVSWITVATNILMGDHEYLWSNTNQPSSVYGRWRLVLESDTNIVDAIDEDCLYRNGPFVYYVNDGSTDGDIYTTVAGNDGNLGVTPDTPKASLQSILNTYDLEPGDIVYLDTGYYEVSVNQVISSFDCGTNGNPVHIVGSTNCFAGGTVFDRSQLQSGSYALQLSAASDVEISDLVLKNAYRGADLSGAQRSVLTRVQAYNTVDSGFSMQNCSNIVMNSCLSRKGSIGFEVNASEYVHLEHSIAWQHTNSALKVDSGWASVTNCVLGGYSHTAYLYHVPSATNIIGDYNAFVCDQAAAVGYISSLGKTCDMLADWRRATTQEVHSLDGDPLFADADNGDFHLKTITPLGRRTPSGGFSSDIETSPLIDSGCPTWPYTNEPVPNGGRVNIGLYGNSWQASIGRTNAWIYAGSLQQGGGVQDVFSLHWVMGNSATSDSVKIEYSWDGGASWAVLTNDVPVGVTEFLWNSTLTNDTPAGLWRVSSLDDTNLVSQTTNFFSVRNSPLNIYVNDAQTNLDVYTTAIGSSSNWRAAVECPQDSLLTVLDHYNLEPGDTVWVDTGSFTNTRNARFGRYQSGTITDPISVIGSTGALYTATVLDRNSTNKNAFALQFDKAIGLTVSNLAVQGGSCGVSITNAAYIQLSLCARDNKTNGIEVLNASHITLSRCLLEDNDHSGFCNAESSDVRVEHSLIRSNKTALRLFSGSTTVRQTILQDSGRGRYIYELPAGAGCVDTDYNDLLAGQQAAVALVAGEIYRSAAEWQFEEEQDLHSLSHEPQFADPGNDDYHVKSEAGRYTAGGLVTDLVTSALIDTGDPADPFSQEPMPNGGRVNIGFYGDSGEASRSRTNGWLLALTLNSGGYIRGTNYIYWVSGGTATGHMVYIDFSADGGVTWTNIGTNIQASEERYLWNTTNQPPTALGVWRVVSQSDTGIYGKTENYFAIKNEPLGYYVNDASTNGDVYCTEPGGVDNDGLRPSTPKDSVQDLIETYTLTPGDLVLIDTGHYILTNALTINDLHGSGTNLVYFKGSTNTSAGGTRLFLQNGSGGIVIEESSKIAVDNLFITNAPVGVRLLESSSCYFSHVVTERCGDGFLVEGAYSNNFQNCGSSAFLTNGIRCVESEDEFQPYANEWNSGVLISAAWTTNTTVLTTGCCVRVEQGSFSVSNSILAGAGQQDHAIALEGSASLTTDYNNYFFTNAAYLAVVRRDRPTIPEMLYCMNVAEWVAYSGCDQYSLTVLPGFHDITGDWHLESLQGRYDPGTEGFVADSSSSLLLDAGDPLAAYTNETEPNGFRRNIGMYGNTSEASRTPTNSYYTIMTMNDGGTVAGTDFLLQWVAHGNATGNTVRIEYSYDGGVSWTIVVSGVSASVGAYEWDTTLFSNSLYGLWRLGSVEELYDTVTNRDFFAVRNGPFSFYVNDASTNGDVYCAAVGAITNDGLTVGTPACSLQDVLDRYDLEGGDTIFIDTGVYTDLAQYVVNQWDSGRGTNRVVIWGSTNMSEGGSLFIGAMLDLQATLGVAVHNLVIEPDGRYGVRLDECIDTLLSGIQVYEADDGFNINQSANAAMTRCVASHCVSNGLLCLDSTNVEWRCGVLWSNRVGIWAGTERFDYCSLDVSSSIFGAGMNEVVYTLDGSDFSADYNCYYLRGGAELASENANPLPARYITLSRWVRDTGRDRHSLACDPRLVAPSIRNFQLSTLGGRKDLFSGNVVTDSVSSCLIDAGDLGAVYSGEPNPNGNRVNIGLYGDTSYAAMTATNGALTVVSLNDGGRAEGTNVVLYWLAHGCATGHTVKLEYSPDNGGSWQDIVSGVVANTDGYIWDTLAFTSSVRALWRVTSLQDATVSDESDAMFALRNAPIHFYVNDNSLVGDMYTVAIGASTNLGLTSDQPKASIASVFETYDLESADVVFVDTGSYDENEIEIGQLDSAQHTNRTPVYLLGSTNELYGGTSLDGSGEDSSISLLRVIGLAMENFSLNNAESENLTVNACWDITMTNVTTRGAETGIFIKDSDHVVLEYCSIREADSRGVYLEENKNVLFEHGVLWSNSGAGVYLEKGFLDFSNNVVVACEAGSYAYYLFAGELHADYNCLFITNGAKAVYRFASPVPDVYDNVSLWTRAEDQDLHSISSDPFFANPVLGDFHLKSQRGRYDVATGVFSNDAVTSPLLDAGAPGADYAYEPAPNGGRVNIGRYGNTDQASRSPTNAAFSVLSLNDGGRTEGQALLTWLAYGDATGHTVRLEFSRDAGISWELIVAGIPASQGESVWSTILYDSTMLGCWRIVSEDEPGVSAENREFFAVRNDPLNFYVNDDSIVGDVYCSAVGSTTNYGVQAEAPKRSLQAILDRWDVEPGDTIYVDTGYYLEPDPISIGTFDAGEETNTLGTQVIIQGSTDEAAGGSVFDFYTGQNGFELTYANGVTFKNLVLKHAGTALRAQASHYCSADFVRVEKCSTGIELARCSPFELSHCIIKDSTFCGLKSDHEENRVIWQNGVLWSNRYGVYKGEGSLTLLNSAVAAFGEEQYGYFITERNAAFTSDFNNINLESGAFCTAIVDNMWTTRYESVALWQNVSGEDTYSLSYEPDFFDPAGGDFHLKSMMGRYQPGVGWTNDRPFIGSRLIDSGKPTTEYDEEPMPNGGRINIGCYGNSSQASMTPDQGWVTLVYPRDTFDVHGDVPIRWITGWVATGHTIRLDFSVDDGSTWSNIVSGLPPAWDGFYLWDVCADAPRTALGRIRVTSEVDPSINDLSARGVWRCGGTIPYYVNDDSTNGDVYCSAVGNDDNDGLTTNTPMRTIQAVLDEYRLAPVDTIFVDSGHYLMSRPLMIDGSDYGEGTNHVIIQGSTNVVVPTVLDRQGGGSAVVVLDSAQGIELRDLVLKNGAAGIQFYRSRDCDVVRVETTEHSGPGFGLAASSESVQFINCLAWNNSGSGVDAEESHFSMENCVCWDNNDAVSYAVGASATFTNCVLQALGSAQRIFSMDEKTDISAARGNYNVYYLAEGAIVAEKVNELGGNEYYGYLLDWQNGVTQDLNSICIDPLFVEPESGDFHLKSVEGRFVPGAGWTNDTVNSPLLDTGYPGSVYTNEPVPNGTRVNVGSYGNTGQASMSRTNPWLQVISLNGGGTIRNSMDLKWTSGLLSNDSLVRLEYTINGGVTWPVMASNVINDVSHYLWDVSEMPLTAQAKWRVVWQDDTNAFNESGWFSIKNNTIDIYVNDQSTLGDVFTSMTGSDANSGTNPAAPLASPYTAFDRYPLGAGDTIWIDTGYYALTNGKSLELNSYSRGSISAPISVFGSDAMAYGGSVIDLKGGSNSVLGIRDTRYIVISNLVLRGASDYGVTVSKSVDCQMYGLIVVSNNYGVSLSSSRPITFQRCMVCGNQGYGIYSVQAESSFDQSVVADNGDACFRLSMSSLSLSNSIAASPKSAGVFYESESTYAGDYNFVYVPDGYAIGYLADSEETYDFLVQWQREHPGQDQHSVRYNPAFVDSANGNYRLMSRAGHFSYSGYVADTGTSWAIDAGAFDADYTQEPAPNGQRLNAGLYGNSVEASKSYTNEPELFVVTLNDGGTMVEPPTLYWLARGLSPTNTVTLEYSYDNGSTWLYVTGGVSIVQQGYYWADTNPPSPEAFWKVTLDADSSVFDTNDTKFIKRTGPITYYVNDSHLVGDIYTTAVGHPDNSGYSSNSPKDSVWGILGNPDYELAGNDRILIDTGHYYETNTIAIDAFNSGSYTASVELVGSTNWIHGGSVLDFSNGVDYAVVYGSETRYVDLKNLVIQHARNGMLFDILSGQAVLSNLVIRDIEEAGVWFASGGHRLVNSVISRCGEEGLHIQAGGGVNLLGSVVWSNMGGALVLDRGGRAAVTNSVIHAYYPGTYCYKVATNAILNADFNNIYVESNAYYVLHNGELLVEGLPQWNLLTTQDIHSLSVDPLFHDAEHDDYHLLSAAGRYDLNHAGYVTTDLVFSCLIDTGATNAPYSNEPEPNGSRVNIGLYGDTDQASKSDTNAWVYAITASSGGQLHGLFRLVWAYGGINPTNEVKLDYSYDNGVTWTGITTATIGDGEYLWRSDIKNYDVFRWYSSPIARWRLTLIDNTNVWDDTDVYFSLRNEPFKYYLNDTSTVDDIYTSVVGNDTNLGFFPWAPKFRLKALLDACDLEGDDSILIDSGRYLIGTNDFAAMGLSDQGKPSAPVTIQGNTNELLSFVVNTSSVKGAVLGINAANIDLKDLGFENGNITLNGDNALFSNLTITNGSVFVNGANQFIEDVSIQHGSINVNAELAAVDYLRVYDGRVSISGTNIDLVHSLVVATSGVAVTMAGNGVDVRNATIVSDHSAIWISGEYCSLYDSIVVGNGPGEFCMYFAGGSSLQADRNNLLARNGAWIGNREGNWEKLLYWQRASGQDTHSVSADPLFVDEAGGDYHLQSVMGHWTPGGWMVDAGHSPCIDFGPELASATNEPEPNGNRVNLGAYGDTEQASKSLTNAWLLAVTMNDGGVLRDTNTLYWRAGNLEFSDLVRIEYSADGGITWVTNATGISATSEQYIWDTTQNASSFDALWRVVLITDTSVLDQCDNSFAVRNTNVIFYVNDASLIGDVYCGAIGNPANDGLTTNTPKDSIQHVLNAYDTEGGDRIRVDTGSYSLTQDVTVIWSRGGDHEHGDFVIQGSTNFVAGGSRLYRGSKASGRDGFDVPASRVSVADISVFGAYRGVYFWSNLFCSADGLLLASNMYGVYGEGAISVTARHSRLVENDVGVYWLRTRTADVVNCTFVNNSNADLYLDNSVLDAVYNNIYYRSISNDVYGGSQGVIDNAFIDYNIYYLLHTNALWGGYTDLMGWQLQQNHDFRSAFTNPLMVDVVNGDYHIQSTVGRYVDGLGWIPAVLDGWGIDKGNPGSDYSMEPSVNGDRINIGAYGGTIYASKGYTNTVVYNRTLNHEAHVDYTNSLWPLIWTVQDVPTDVTFSVEYSGDNGATWYVLTNGISPYKEYHIWQTSPFFNTYAGLWRVISDDGKYSDTNDAPFDIFYGDYEITHEGLSGDLNYIVWVGAWSENYRVQYSDAWMASSNGINWYNAPTGAGPNQTPWFDAPNGGDLTYEDIESTNMPYRLYRVIWDDAL